MWPWPWLWLWFGGSAPVLRSAELPDCRRMAEIHAAGFAIGWERGEFEQMLLSGHLCDVQVSSALFGEIVTGFAMSRIVAGEAELLTIALDPETRGRGQSVSLLQAHCANLRRAGAEVLFLEVAADNAPALQLYRRTGFAEIGRRKGYYPPESGDAGPRRDALTMRLDLSWLDPTPRYA